MSKEVSGQPEGVTLLECINTGVVPYPERMSYVRWLEWRRQTGSRPVKRRDGRSTSSADEVTSCAKVLREATGFKPQFLVGLGQGGLVAAVLK